MKYKITITLMCLLSIFSLGAVPHKENEIQPLINNFCGPANGHTRCYDSLCCSQFGYCGTTNVFCCAQSGCQWNYGRCDFNC
jgi:hypothetical protein